MGRPRIHRRSAVTQRPTTARPPDPTAKNRMRAYRDRLRETAEKKAYEERQTRQREILFCWSPWLPEFLSMISIDAAQAVCVSSYGFQPKLKVDFVTARAAWKRAAVRLHPDRPDGDEAKAKRLNELWAMYQLLEIKT
jgi:hypothetical protein